MAHIERELVSSFRQRYVKDLTSSGGNEAGCDRTGIPLVVLGRN